jgi:organic hydroperoxide reductase OsmC/OhrA
VSEHKITIEWKLSAGDFTYEKYSRDHTWNFGGTNTIDASSAPEYYGNAGCVNPEQAFAASLSSCHMLTFLAMCSRRGYRVLGYTDEAAAVLGKNKSGKIAVTKVILRPVVVFSKEKAPVEEQFQLLHDRAHDNCFIANSFADCVAVTVVPVMKQE